MLLISILIFITHVVTGIIEWNVKPISIEASIGQNKFVNCSFKNNNNQIGPTYWLLNGQLLTYQNTINSNLILLQTNDTAFGYACLLFKNITNIHNNTNITCGIGLLNHTVYIYVYNRPSLTLFNNINTYTIHEYEDVILKFKYSGYPWPNSKEIFWFFNNVLINLNEFAFPYLHMSQVSRFEAGIYNLTVKTITGSSSVGIRLSIRYPPDGQSALLVPYYVILDQYVTVPCARNITGIPQPIINWYYSSRTAIFSSNHSLTFHHIGLGNAGYYTCQLMNSEGILYFNYSIIVQKLKPENISITIEPKGVEISWYPPNDLYKTHIDNYLILIRSLYLNTETHHTTTTTNTTTTLLPAIKYHLWLMSIVNNVGGCFSEQIAFITPDGLPILSTVYAYSRRVANLLQIDINWSLLAIGTMNAEILIYKVEFLEQDYFNSSVSNEWQLLGYSKKISAIFIRLTPQARYKFRVQAIRNDSVIGNWSISDWCQNMNEGRPLLSPEDSVNTIFINDNTVLFSIRVLIPGAPPNMLDCIRVSCTCERCGHSTVKSGTCSYLYMGDVIYAVISGVGLYNYQCEVTLSNVYGRIIINYTLVHVNIEGANVIVRKSINPMIIIGISMLLVILLPIIVVILFKRDKATRHIEKSKMETRDLYSNDILNIRLLDSRIVFWGYNTNIYNMNVTSTTTILSSPKKFALSAYHNYVKLGDNIGIPDLHMLDIK